MTRPKDIGTQAETAVVRALRELGFAQAERRSLRGRYDAGDVTGTIGLAWSVKGGAYAKTASDGQIALWLSELETQRRYAIADHGVLVTQRSGIGAPNARHWWAHMPMSSFMVLVNVVGMSNDVPGTVRMTLETMTALLRHAGYGSPLTVDQVS